MSLSNVSALLQLVFSGSPVFLTPGGKGREHWMISHRRLIWLLLPNPSPTLLISKLSLFINLLVCRRASLLKEEMGGKGKGRSQIIRRRENLVLYKSFNTLWGRGRIANWRTNFRMSLPQAILKMSKSTNFIFANTSGKIFRQRRHPKRSQAKNLCAL